MFKVKKIECDRNGCNRKPTHEIMRNNMELINGNTTILLCAIHLAELKMIVNSKCPHRKE